MAWFRIEPPATVARCHSPGGPVARHVDDAGALLHGTYYRRDLYSATATIALASTGALLTAVSVPAYRSALRSPLLSAANHALSQIPWCWDSADGVVASDPMEVTVARVAVGAKPGGLAEPADGAAADRLERLAAIHGLAIRRTAVRDGLRVAVAARSTFAQLFDLSAIHAEYAAAGLCANELVAIAGALDELGDAEVLDVLTDPQLSGDPMRGGRHDDAGGWVRAGLALGYPPATTAGWILEGRLDAAVHLTPGWDWMHTLAATAATRPLPRLPAA